MPTREKGVELFRFCNNYIGDIQIATLLQVRIYIADLNDEDAQHFTRQVQRLLLSHLVMTLWKIAECYDRYHAEVDGDVAIAFKAVAKEIRARGVPAFRHTVVGHILDDDTQRPVTHKEIDVMFANMTRGDFPGFYNWVNDAGPNVFPTTVISVVQRIRDDMVARYGFTEANLIA